MSDELLPMWVADPNIRYPLIGWNMGPVEDYKGRFWNWFNGLTHEQTDDYAKRYPEPKSWAGQYAQIRKDRENG